MVSQKHQRRSIRLKGYDYSQAGGYFITICTQDRRHLFGNIVDGKMILNDAGKMVWKIWNEIPKYYPGIDIDAFQTMPNHIHGIIQIVGAGPRACPDDMGQHNNIGQPQGVAPTGDAGAGLSLPDVVHRFKTMTTNEYIRGVKSLHWQRFNKRMWQRNYYEHIIRNENEYHRIAQYIHDNPVKWENDRLNDRNNNDVMESPEKYGREPWMI